MGNVLVNQKMEGLKMHNKQEELKQDTKQTEVEKEYCSCGQDVTNDRFYENHGACFACHMC